MGRGTVGGDTRTCTRYKLCPRCSGSQTVASKPANKRSFRLTLGANKRKVRLTLPANEPTFHVNSPQTAR
jgi:hypothetical protein